MTQIESTISVQQPLEEVFVFLNASESHAKFIPNMAEFRQTSPGVFGNVGATAEGLLNYWGLLRIPVHYQIIEHEPDQQLAMKGKMGPIDFRDGYLLRRDGDGTEIRFWLELLPAGWAKLFSPFMGLVGKVHAWETLRNLKRELAKAEIASSPLRNSSQ
jgi:carbon monoxide dehydrogenase subunit G